MTFHSAHEASERTINIKCWKASISNKNWNVSTNFEPEKAKTRKDNKTKIQNYYSSLYFGVLQCYSNCFRPGMCNTWRWHIFTNENSIVIEIEPLLMFKQTTKKWFRSRRWKNKKQNLKDMDGVLSIASELNEWKNAYTNWHKVLLKCKQNQPNKSKNERKESIQRGKKLKNNSENCLFSLIERNAYK